MTERDIQIAAVSWSIGTLMTTLLVLGSYLAWWRAEKEGRCTQQPRTCSPAATGRARSPRPLR